MSISNAAKTTRVYELARELGLTNKECLELCLAMGIGVTHHSASIDDIVAGLVRKKAEREGLKRPSSQASEARVTSDLPARPPSTGRTESSTQGPAGVLNSKAGRKIRVYELARELGLTNQECLELCLVMGIGVTRHYSSIDNLQAERVRKKANREDLKRSRLGQPHLPPPGSPHPTPARRPVRIRDEAIARRGGRTSLRGGPSGLPSEGPTRVFVDGRCSACGRLFYDGVERATVKFVLHECGGREANDEWRFDR